MTYEVIWTAHADKQLGRLDKKTGKRIFNKVEDIKEDPFRYVRRLVGQPLYRLRVGDYRVILSIENNKLVIFVMEVDLRSSRIYKKF